MVKFLKVVRDSNNKITEVTSMDNKQAYDALDSSGLQWDRKDSTHILVWTTGYITQDAHNVERFLMQAGMRCISHDFDSHCGKTRSIFKHKV